MRRVVLVVATVASVTACSSPRAAVPPVTYVDEHTLRGDRNFLTGYDTRNADGTYNMAVEIPTGTSEKWEICTDASLHEPATFPGCTATGREMVHEIRDGARRLITHIGYPGNYGAFPRTRAEDGDPLDVIAIGPMAERGSVIAVRVVGLIRCRDGDEQDDKVVAIARDSPLFGQVSTAVELEALAPGAADILFSWYMGYRGEGGMSCSRMEDEGVAASLIAQASAAFTMPAGRRTRIRTSTQPE